MNIAFRTDASIHTGIGHFMRCLALADVLRRNGAYIQFVCCDLPEHLRSLLAERQYELRELPLPTTEDCGHQTVQSLDAARTIEALSSVAWDWLVVDHYGLFALWETAMRSLAKKILVVDDLADRAHDCDLLLDQNFYSDMESRYQAKVPRHCKLLVGPRYALLREEFPWLRQSVKPRTGAVRRILVCFGGIDGDNYTLSAIRALDNLGGPEWHVDVVIGFPHPFRTEIESACAANRFECHVQSNRMGELMARADLFIGAGGSTTWERCCLGLPGLTLALAPNQRRCVQDGALHGFLYAPALSGGAEASIQLHLRAMMDNPMLLRQMSLKGLELVDGRGTQRVANHLLSGSEHTLPLHMPGSKHRTFVREKPSLTESLGNILVTSAAKKSPLVQAVKLAARRVHPGIKVIAGDTDEHAVARYVADEFWNMPPTRETEIDHLMGGCKERDIRTVFPTRDGELLFWALHRDRFATEGIHVVVSPADSVTTCIDKLAFAQYGAAHGLSFIPTSLRPEQVGSGPYVVKERYGAGSRNVGLNLDRERALKWGRRLKEPIYQPFIRGTEISIDAWLDRFHRVKGLILRRRDQVIDGESQVTTTFRNAVLEQKATVILEMLELAGPVVMQAFFNSEGAHLIECNTRTGGASTASIAVGLDFFYWSLLESFGGDTGTLVFDRSPCEVRQIRVKSDIHIYGHHF